MKNGVEETRRKVLVLLVLLTCSLFSGLAEGLGSYGSGDIPLDSTDLLMEVGSWDVATDNQGQMVVVYSHEQSGGSEVYFAGISPQLQIDSLVRVCSSDDQVTSISIMQGSDQTYRLAYATYRMIHPPSGGNPHEANLNIFTSLSTDGGRTWSPPQLALGGNRSAEGSNKYLDLCLGEDADGVLWMYWNFAYYYKDGIAGRFTTSIDGGVTWSPVQRMLWKEGDTGGHIRVEGLTADSRRQLHLLYTSHIFNGRGDIWLAQTHSWSEGERIVPYIEITSATIYSQNTNHAWGDRLWVLWNDIGYMSQRYILDYSDDSGEIWQTYGCIDRGIIGSGPKLASMEINSSHEWGLYVFWQDGDGVKSSPIGKVIGELGEIPQTALAVVMFLLLMAASPTRCGEPF